MVRERAQLVRDHVPRRPRVGAAVIVDDAAAAAARCRASGRRRVVVGYLHHDVGQGLDDIFELL